MKVTVVGAGNVGATVANVLATKAFCSEVVLVDIKEGVPEGKAIDIMQTAHMLNFDTTVKASRLCRTIRTAMLLRRAPRSSSSRPACRASQA